MSFRIVRNSKFRHVFGQALKREFCFDNIRITKNAWDSPFCSINPKFFAVILEAAGGGAFLVIPLSKTGRVDPTHPVVSGHKGPVLDLAWCPFNDNVIASASEDCIVRVWQIPENGLLRSLVDPVVELIGHQRRVGLISWHPSANNVLMSAGGDSKIIVWNVGTGEIISEIDHPDVLFHCCWNWDGSLIATTCKDKKIRVYNPRSGEVEQDGLGHEGAKPQRVVFLKNGLIFSTGFSRMSERQYALRSMSAISEPIVVETLDISNGILYPFYDPDVNLLYMCAKGDSNIRYFEITDEPPFVHYISTYQSTEPQRGGSMMPKRGCDVRNCEIGRFFKLHSKGFVEVISFTVPRKSELFQEDLYPETASDQPAISAEEWANGADAEPLMVSPKDGFVSQQKEELKVVKKPNILNKMPNKPSAPAQLTPPENSSGHLSDDEVDGLINELTKLTDKKLEDAFREIQKLKIIVVKHENRIKELEKKLDDKNASENEFSTPPPRHWAIYTTKATTTYTIITTTER